jgi:hypothetical protein
MSILESFGWFHNLAHYSPDRREFILESEHYAEYLHITMTPRDITTTTRDITTTTRDITTTTRDITMTTRDYYKTQVLAGESLYLSPNTTPNISLFLKQ